MIKRLYKHTLIIGALTIGLSGCKEYKTVEEIYKTEEHYYVGSEVITRDFVIEKKSWIWNDLYSRYECTIGDVKEIDENLYKYGTIVGTLFTKEENAAGAFIDVQKTLPFIQTYKDLALPYTETISFDILYGTSPEVTFFIQTSDGSMTSPLIDNYKFKIAFIRDSED